MAGRRVVPPPPGTAADTGCFLDSRESCQFGKCLIGRVLEEDGWLSQIGGKEQEMSVPFLLAAQPLEARNRLDSVLGGGGASSTDLALPAYLKDAQCDPQDL